MVTLNLPYMRTIDILDPPDNLEPMVRTAAAKCIIYAPDGEEMLDLITFINRIDISKLLASAGHYDRRAEAAETIARIMRAALEVPVSNESL